MNKRIRVITTSVGVLGWWSLVSVALAQAPPAPGNLQSVLDRIHRHAANDDWRTAAWQDKAIEEWLDHAVGLIAKVAKYPDLKSPVRIANTKPQVLPSGGDVTGALIVGKDLDLKSLTLTNCVVLSDGNVQVQSASGCVIVARGALCVELFSQYCVFVSGAYVSVLASDGTARDPTSNGSVILSRGWADVQSAYGSFVFAHEGTAIRSARDATFINAALVGNSDRGGNRTIRVRGMPLEELPVPFFAKPLRVEGVVRVEAKPVESHPIAISPNPAPIKPPLGVVLKYGNQRFFAAIGRPIVDQDAKEVEGLRGWRVAFSDDMLAILSSDNADVAVRLDGR